ncbi:leucyl/phenylalanyl-tRNA--protein transferase [Candidatus Kapabacteria bacterium]|nr:leucyl/phenylalanyl-tRNA--protein transferase [Candidatus Kapabacteria bacterium]
MKEILTPDIIVSAYTQAFFPMADEDDGEIYWHNPDPRAIIPLDNPKMPRSLKQSIKKNNFTFSVNGDFDCVIRSCSKRKNTWISEDIIDIYNQLNVMGFAHSVECLIGKEIVGGLYGVSIGGAFFGESMFNFKSDSAKAAFYYLIEYLKSKNFILLDSQYINPFTEQLGAIEISKSNYLKLLNKALSLPCKFV